MKNFETFLKENYFANLSKSTIDKKKAQMKKQAEMPDDDPSAYKELPGDVKGKKNLKTSQHTKKYHDLYGEKVDEAVSSGSFSGFNWIYDKPFKILTFQEPGFDKGPRNFRQLDIKKIGEAEAQRLIKKLQSEDYVSWNILKSILKREGVDFEIASESLNEKEQSTDRSPIDNEAIETGLKNKSDDTGVPIGILRAVMRRGMAAWKSGHRPGAGQEQWGYARVNSFLTKGKGTWGKADSDLAKEVRDGGHDKGLKESSTCEYEALIESFDSKEYEEMVSILKALHSFSDKIKFRTEEVNGHYNIVYDDPKGMTEDILQKLKGRNFWNTDFATTIGKFNGSRVNIAFEKSAQDTLNIKDFDSKNWSPKKR